MRRKLALLAVPALLFGMLPAAAAAVAGSPYAITADNSGAVPPGHNWSFNDFFPRALTVPQGATLQVPIEGFHTFTILGGGTTLAADIAAANIGAADPDDTTRNPNGTVHAQERFVALAPQLPSPGCGAPASPCAFDGSATISSGLPSGPGGPGGPGGPPPPFALTITANPGTYSFHCRVHPHMTGTLVVVAAGDATAQTPDQVLASAAAQTNVDVAQAGAAEDQALFANSSSTSHGITTWRVSVGAVSANGYASILEFLSGQPLIHRGDRVTFVASDPNEPHTVTFPRDIHTDMAALCEGPNGTDTPAIPKVIPPTGPQDFACGANPPDELGVDGGNGVSKLASPTTVSDSGFMSGAGFGPGYGAPSSVALRTWTVTILPTAKRGVYHFLCQIHFGMIGTLIVH